MLAYTLSRLLVQRAVLQRDAGGSDRFGAQLPSNWQDLATVPCRVWWWPETQRGPAREDVSSTRTVAVSDGGIMLGLGVDVTEQDRVARVTGPDGRTLYDGPFNILAVIRQETHLELSVRRP